mmetsp:Transcript_92320/g.260823  ORF Transcript_92320/g.260823 Transcript_92320/m.260823 type:complete len:244 (+) Transcript_92320:1645-2376(+)
MVMDRIVDSRRHEPYLIDDGPEVPTSRDVMLLASGEVRVDETHGRTSELQPDACCTLVAAHASHAGRHLAIGNIGQMHAQRALDEDDGKETDHMDVVHEFQLSGIRVFDASLSPLSPIDPFTTVSDETFCRELTHFLKTEANDVGFRLLEQYWRQRLFVARRRRTHIPCEAHQQDAVNGMALCAHGAEHRRAIAQRRVLRLQRREPKGDHVAVIPQLSVIRLLLLVENEAEVACCAVAVLQSV